jgi:hypothetical protein
MSGADSFMVIKAWGMLVADTGGKYFKLWNTQAQYYNF